MYVLVGSRYCNLLLVNPIVLSRLPAQNLLWLEPESDFLLCVLDGVGAVADVTSDINGEITTDGTWSRSQWVGSTEKDTSGLDSITTLEDDGGDWAGVHVLDETGEEWLVREIGIVLLEVLLAWRDELESCDFVSLGLEAGDDLTDESTLDTVGLDGNEGLLVRHDECI